MLFIFIVCIPARCILHVNYVLSYLKISVRCNINTLKSTKVSDVSTYTQVCWILVMNKPHTCLHKYTSHYLLYIVFIVADASVGRDCINLHEFHSNFLSVSKYVIYTNCNIVSTLYSCQFMRIKSLSLLLSCMSALSYVFSYFLQVGLIYLVRPIINFWLEDKITYSIQFIPVANLKRDMLAFTPPFAWYLISKLQEVFNPSLPLWKFLNSPIFSDHVYCFELIQIILR